MGMGIGRMTESVLLERAWPRWKGLLRRCCFFCSFCFSFSACFSVVELDRCSNDWRFLCTGVAEAACECASPAAPPCCTCSAGYWNVTEDPEPRLEERVPALAFSDSRSCGLGLWGAANDDPEADDEAVEAEDVDLREARDEVEVVVVVVVVAVVVAARGGVLIDTDAALRERVWPPRAYPLGLGVGVLTVG